MSADATFPIHISLFYYPPTLENAIPHEGITTRTVLPVRLSVQSFFYPRRFQTQCAYLCAGCPGFLLALFAAVPRSFTFAASREFLQFQIMRLASTSIKAYCSQRFKRL